MKNRFPTWLEIASFTLLLLNLPILFLEVFPGTYSTIPVIPLEWGFTILFTIDYALRIFLAKDRKAYILGFGGIVDFIATVPQYLIALIPGASGLYVLRTARIARFVIRGLKAIHTSGSAIGGTLDIQKHLGANEQLVTRGAVSRLHYAKVYASCVVILAIIVGIAVSFELAPYKGIPLGVLSVYVTSVIVVIIIVMKEIDILKERFAVTNHRVLNSTEILEERVVSIAMQHITDITLRQSLLEKILDTGSLDIRTSGEATAVHLVGIRKPLEIKKLIENGITTRTQTR